MKEGKQTWMLSWSEHQSSATTVSGWFGTRTVEQDLPANMREMGDLTELAYSCLRQQHKALRRQRKRNSVHRVVSLSHTTGCVPLA